MSDTKQVALCALCLVLLVACTEDGAIDVYLLQSPNVEEDPLEPSLVTHLSIRVTGPDMDPVADTFTFKPGGSSTLTSVPAGPDRIITVEGLAGEDGLPISRGRSVPMEIEEGDQIVELFIARIGRFSYTHEYGLAEARFAHSAVLSDQGQLFVISGATAGSFDDPQGMTPSVEVFDPTSGKTAHLPCSTSQGRACLIHPRARAAGVRTANGIVLLGGLGEDGALGVAELINTRNRTIEDLGAKGSPRFDATVVSVGDQSLVAGGRDAQGNPVPTAELMDASGNIAQLALPGPRWAMAGAETLGRIFLFGGFDQAGQVTAEFVLFDPRTRAFSVHGSSVKARAWASAVALSDGRVLVAGGMDQDGQAVTDVDLFDPRHGALCPIGKLLHGRWLAAAVKLPDGSAFVIGGLTGADPDRPTAEAEILDPRFVTFEASCNQKEGELSVDRRPGAWIPRYGASAAVLPNNAVALTGGLTVEGGVVTYPVNEIEIFVPE